MINELKGMFSIELFIFNKFMFEYLSKIEKLFISSILLSSFI